jgi:hypothetical protein
MYYLATCPKCNKQRELSYKAFWYVRKHPETTCKPCRKPNLEGLKKGHGWNKGLKGFRKGHPPYVHMFGENNPAWKGDQVGYTALHYWIRRQKGDAVRCEDCGKRGKCHWANLSGKYRRDVEDFKSLCPSCHKYFDLGRRVTI